ncbi:MAG: carboxylesterase/lipase family protein [Gammaproteobacteria bacterium]
MTARIHICVAVGLLSLAAGALLADGHALPDRAQIDTGKLLGSVEDGVAVFRGIPFAASPVGELRWRPPKPVKAWDGVRDATQYGPVCPQKLGSYPDWADAHFQQVGVDEDCLFLNIWTPVNRDGPLPVMFYIHGGNMQYGSGSMPLYEGHLLAQQDVVLVTINYRLGYLGRFAHPAMTRAQGDEPLANYGVFDQIAALEWVQRNIAAFGGDPDRVTIAGHSAGGVSVNILMLTPQSEGLFHGAIAMGSGMLLDATQHAFEAGPPGPAGFSRENLGEDLVDYFKIDARTDAQLLSALRALPPEDLVAYAGKRQVPFNPVVDDMVVVDHVARVFERGEQHDVPYIGGANSWEWDQIDDIPLIGKWFLGGALIEGLSDEDLAVFDDQWTRIGLSQRWFSEGLFLTSTRYLAKQMANVDSPAWLYHTMYINEKLRGEIPGSVHGLEMPYVFGNVRKHPEFQRPRSATQWPATEQDLAFGDTVQAYWVNFVKTGNPNGANVPPWPEYRPDTDLAQVFDVDFAPQAGLYKETLDYLEERAMIRRREFEEQQARN